MLEKSFQFYRVELKALQKTSDLCDMSDDKLAQVITGNPNTKSCDVTNEQLEAVIREAKQ